MGAGSTPAETARARSSVVEHRNRRFRIFPIVASALLLLRGAEKLIRARSRRFGVGTDGGAGDGSFSKQSPFPTFPHRLCSSGAASRFLRVTTGGRKPASCPRREGAPRCDFPWRSSAAATGSGYFVAKRTGGRAQAHTVRASTTSGGSARPARSFPADDLRLLLLHYATRSVMTPPSSQRGGLFRVARRGSDQARFMISAMKRRRPEGSTPQP
jgi:hypothetical protein